MAIKDHLGVNSLQTLHMHTVSNWIDVLGFKFCNYKKNYNNDKHKSLENITYCKNFIKKYFKYKRQTHCWIQINTPK